MASEDRVLKILLQIQSDLSGLKSLQSGVAEVKKGLDDTTQSALSWGDAFMVGGAVGAVQALGDVLREIPATFEDAVKAGVEFNSQLQQTQIGIAAALRQNMSDVYGSFSDATRAAGGVIDELKAKANELGLSYQQNFEAYQHSINAMLGGGVTDTQKQIDLILTLNAAVRSLGLGATVTARDINDMLSGFASRTIAGRQLAAGMGFSDVQDLDRAIQQARALGQLYPFMVQHTNGFREAIIAMAETYQGQVNRMQNATKDLQSDLAQPIMQPLSEAIQSLADLMRSSDVQSAMQSLGGFIADLVQGFAGLTQVISSSISGLERFASVASSLVGNPVVGLLLGKAAGNSGDLASFNTVVAIQKQTEEMVKQVGDAHDMVSQTEARLALESAIRDVKAEISTLSGDDKLHSEQNLKVLEDELANFEKYAGAAAIVPAKPADMTKQLEAIKEVEDKISVLNAEAAGDKTAVVAARAAEAYDQIKKALIDKGVLEKDATAEAEKYKDALIAAGNAAIANKDAHRDVVQFLREESALVEHIHNQQQVINANPFLSADQKQALSIPLIAQEIVDLNAKIQQGQALMHGGTLDPEKYAEVAKAVDTLRTRVQLLGFQLQETSFGGTLAADLTKWANSFGTAAQQVSTTLTSTLNTAIGSTSQALAGLIFQTGNWKQTFASAIESIVAGVIRMGLQFVVTRLLMATINRAAGAADAATAGSQAAGAAAAWSPAAVSASIATFGAASGSGLAAYLAALASGEAGAATLATIGTGAAGTGFQKGGYTGGSDPGRVAGPAHEMEFIFGSEAVRTLGVPFLERLHDAARSGGGPQLIGPPVHHGRGGGGPGLIGPPLPPARYHAGGEIYGPTGYASNGDYRWQVFGNWIYDKQTGEWSTPGALAVPGMPGGIDLPPPGYEAASPSGLNSIWYSTGPDDSAGGAGVSLAGGPPALQYPIVAASSLPGYAWDAAGNLVYIGLDSYSAGNIEWIGGAGGQPSAEIWGDTNTGPSLEIVPSSGETAPSLQYPDIVASSLPGYGWDSQGNLVYLGGSGAAGASRGRGGAAGSGFMTPMQSVLAANAAYANSALFGGAFYIGGFGGPGPIDTFEGSSYARLGTTVGERMMPHSRPGDYQQRLAALNQVIGPYTGPANPLPATGPNYAAMKLWQGGSGQVKILHSGGDVLGADEAFIIGQLGEYMMQRSAVDHYENLHGPGFFDRLNRMELNLGSRHAGGPIHVRPEPITRSNRGLGGLGSGGGQINNHFALFFDERMALKHLKSREGIKTLVDLINGNITQLRI